MKYDVEVQFSFNHNIKHASHILMGLVLLEEKNIINLCWKNLSLAAPGHRSISIIAKKKDSGITKKISFDMHDMSSYFELDTLNDCDVYFKRSIFMDDILKLEKSHQDKVMTYGMNLPTTKLSLSKVVLWKSFLQISRDFMKPSVHILKLLNASRNSYQQFFGLPSQEFYFQRPETNVPPNIFFQTRLWPQEYVGQDSANELNDTRISLVRALRKEFGDRFVGGVLPTEFAKQHCPDCITNHATDSKGYIKLLKSNLVGIYTRGLNHSIALKMPEYIAASLCVVTDNIRNTVAGSFEKGNNYLEFTDVDSCVANCDKLLSDNELAQNMRMENYKYYLANLEPANKALQCLDEAFGNN